MLGGREKIKLSELIENMSTSSQPDRDTDEKVSHRDLSPANILSAPTTKIDDLGFSHFQPKMMERERKPLFPEKIPTPHKKEKIEDILEDQKVNEGLQILLISA